ncbi:hypothetical protein FF38_03704 [Lucilia cuprina]|uniref:Uncharacterized protein n=1 Tax=Lucilia cuprina TaxID=7375 RepID=A0A0L0C1S2_LUCCU|nr:hypothetical protein FF38_03704 [Lucilia cuprina]
MTQNPDGDNHPSISNYVSEMSLTGTYGRFCELVGATQLYPICIEVYYNGELYVKHGNNDNSVKRDVAAKYQENNPEAHREAGEISRTTQSN